MSQRLFSRGWAMKRIDGDRGALCGMTPVDDSTVSDVVRKFKRLLEWATHFGIDTCIPEMIEWAETGPHIHPLYVNTEFAWETPTIINS